jgi:hypothetical protein
VDFNQLGAAIFSYWRAGETEKPTRKEKPVTLPPEQTLNNAIATNIMRSPALICH